MTEFATSGSVRIEVDESSLRQARDRVEREIGSVQVDATAATDGGRPGGMIDDAAITNELADQTGLLEDLLDEVEGGGAGGLGSGGSGGGGGGGVGGGGGGDGVVDTAGDIALMEWLRRSVGRGAGAAGLAASGGKLGLGFGAGLATLGGAAASFGNMMGADTGGFSATPREDGSPWGPTGTPVGNRFDYGALQDWRPEDSESGGSSTGSGESKDWMRIGPEDVSKFEEMGVNVRGPYQGQTGEFYRVPESALSGGGGGGGGGSSSGTLDDLSPADRTAMASVAGGAVRTPTSTRDIPTGPSSEIPPSVTPRPGNEDFRPQRGGSSESESNVRVEAPVTINTDQSGVSASDLRGLEPEIRRVVERYLRSQGSVVSQQQQSRYQEGF